VGESRTDRPRSDLDKLTVAQAAEALGISQDAVRKRIARGTIPHDRDVAGRVHGVHVYLSPSETVHKTDQDTVQDDAAKTLQDTYIRSLEDQIAFLRRELERKDTILLNLTERIPELEAPQEAAEAAETAEEEPERAEPHSATGGAQEGARRPWWRRVFGG
jgi:excisionase family DNA binding protein